MGVCTGNDDDNFGSCELCGVPHGSCTCYENAGQHQAAQMGGEGWLEAQLEDLLDADPNFEILQETCSMNDGTCSSVVWNANGGVPLCADTAPLGLSTDRNAAHPVTPAMSCGSKYELGSAQCTRDVCAYSANGDNVTNACVGKCAQDGEQCGVCQSEAKKDK